MAFSLKIVTPNDTVNFQISTSVTFTGYRLLSYVAGDTSGGSGPAVDTIVCEIVGSGATAAAATDDAFNKLRALRRAVYWADADNMGQNTSGPAYLELQPVSSANASWAVVFGGRVTEPAADLSILKGVITGVTVTLQREPYWRGIKPAYSSTIANISTNISTVTNLAGRGSLSVSSILGDLPALVYMRAGAANALYVNQWGGRFAYVSQRNHPVGYNAFGFFSAPAATTLDGCSSVADANAENGSGNCAQTNSAWTFPTIVISQAISQIGIAYRVFARLRNSAAATQWNVRAHGTVSSSTGYEPLIYGGVTQEITSTTYNVYDLGVIQFPNYTSSFFASNTGGMRTGLSAGRISGAGNLNIDWLYLMPVSEYYLESSFSIGNTSALIYDNMTPTPRNVPRGYALNGSDQPTDISSSNIARGVLRIPPGSGYFYWLITLPNGTTPGTYDFALRYVPLYNTHRGTGA